MTQNNPNLDLVNIEVHIKFGQFLSIGSHDIERKRNDQIHIIMEGQGKSSIVPRFQSGAIKLICRLYPNQSTSSEMTKNTSKV